MTQYTSVCPYDCPDACGLVVDVEGGRVVSVKGDESHPLRGGRCARRWLTMNGRSIRRGG